MFDQDKTVAALLFTDGREHVNCMISIDAPLLDLQYVGYFAHNHSILFFRVKLRVHVL